MSGANVVPDVVLFDSNQQVNLHPYVHIVYANEEVPDDAQSALILVDLDNAGQVATIRNLKDDISLVRYAVHEPESIGGKRTVHIEGTFLPDNVSQETGLEQQTQQLSVAGMSESQASRTMGDRDRAGSGASTLAGVLTQSELAATPLDSLIAQLDNRMRSVYSQLSAPEFEDVFGVTARLIAPSADVDTRDSQEGTLLAQSITTAFATTETTSGAAAEQGSAGDAVKSSVSNLSDPGVSSPPNARRARRNTSEPPLSATTQSPIPGNGDGSDRTSAHQGVSDTSSPLGDGASTTMEQTSKSTPSLAQGGSPVMTIQDGPLSAKSLVNDESAGGGQVGGDLAVSQGAVSSHPSSQALSQLHSPVIGSTIPQPGSPSRKTPGALRTIASPYRQSGKNLGAPADLPPPPALTTPVMRPTQDAAGTTLQSPSANTESATASPPSPPLVAKTTGTGLITQAAVAAAAAKGVPPPGPGGHHPPPLETLAPATPNRPVLESGQYTPGANASGMLKAQFDTIINTSVDSMRMQMESLTSQYLNRINIPGSPAPGQEAAPSSDTTTPSARPRPLPRVQPPTQAPSTPLGEGQQSSLFPAVRSPLRATSSNGGNVGVQSGFHPQSPSSASATSSSHHPVVEVPSTGSGTGLSRGTSPGSTIGRSPSSHTGSTPRGHRTLFPGTETMVSNRSSTAPSSASEATTIGGDLEGIDGSATIDMLDTAVSDVSLTDDLAGE